MPPSASSHASRRARPSRRSTPRRFDRKRPLVADEPGEQPEELSPEELLEHIRRMKVSDLLLSTITTVAQLGYAKLDGRDLEQAKLAIEALRALVPVLEGAVPEELTRDYQQVTANLQVAYLKAAEEESGDG